VDQRQQPSRYEHVARWKRMGVGDRLVENIEMEAAGKRRIADQLLADTLDQSLQLGRVVGRPNLSFDVARQGIGTTCRNDRGLGPGAVEGAGGSRNEQRGNRENTAKKHCSSSTPGAHRRAD